MTETIIARFTFKPDRAGEFLFEEDQTVTEFQVDTVEEVMAFVHEFDDALLDASALVNHQVISLGDFTTSEGEAK